ncbi:Uncharacterised protein [Vibrio cholerae]|nr:Uncharacterised protein [Vibrio cholerae]
MISIRYTKRSNKEQPDKAVTARGRAMNHLVNCIVKTLCPSGLKTWLIINKLRADVKTSIVL